MQRIKTVIAGIATVLQRCHWCDAKIKIKIPLDDVGMQRHIERKCSACRYNDQMAREMLEEGNYYNQEENQD